MSEFTSVANNLIENLPGIIVALTGLVVVWKKIDAVGAHARESVNRTIEGNEKLAEIHGMMSAGKQSDAPAEVKIVNAEPIEVTEAGKGEQR